MEDLMNEMETTMDEIQYIVVKLGNENMELIFPVWIIS